MEQFRRQLLFVVLLLLQLAGAQGADEARFRIATFSADVTCPVGHPLLGGLYPDATEIVDPLLVRGFVLLTRSDPIVLCAIDWCEIRNGSYDLWRDALAKAAGTRRERVLFCCLHQHDAPLTDMDARRLLEKHDLHDRMFDDTFELTCIERTAAALSKSLKNPRPVTHLGTGKARVDRIASSRRVQEHDGSTSYRRGSNSGGDEFLANADVGLIDPWIRTLSFWNGDKPVVAVHAYATHPMSYYGKGGVTSDFVGTARERLQAEQPEVFHIYASGCSGDVTAGKYNDGSAEQRPLLANRLLTAMKASFASTKTQMLTKAEFRSTPLDLQFRKSPRHTRKHLTEVLANPQAKPKERILAAMGLASLNRVECGQAIDFPCIDFGRAKLLLFPGEAFVGYQLQAQKMAEDSFVLSMGYGECWPGYVPTTQGLADNFDNVWYWVDKDSDRRMKTALKRLLAQ